MRTRGLRPGHADLRGDVGRERRAPVSTPSARPPGSRRSMNPAIAPPASVEARATFTRRVTAGGRWPSAPLRPHDLRFPRAGVQGGGVQRCLAGGQRGVRRGACLEPGSRPQNHRLNGRLAAETPRPSRSYGTTCSCPCRTRRCPRSSTCQHRRRAIEAGLEVEVNARPGAGVDPLRSGAPPSPAPDSEGSAAGGVDVSGNDLPNAHPLHRVAGRAAVAAVGVGSAVLRPRRRGPSGGITTTKPTWKGRPAYSWSTSAPA